MTVKELAEKLDLTIVCGISQSNQPVTGGFCSDLLSYVMGKATEGQVWMTIQKHKNIMAVAALKDLAAIIIADGMQPEPDVIETGNDEGIVVMTSKETSYQLAGKIYKLLEA